MKVVQFSVLTWNIAGVYKPEFESRYGWNARRAEVCSFLKERTKQHVVFLQEATDESIPDLLTVFPEVTHFTQYHKNSTRCGLYVFIAIPKILFGNITPLIIPYEPRMSWIIVQCDNFTFVNSHFPTGYNERMKSTEHLSVEIGKLKTNIIMCGDMNTFPDGGGFRQVALILDKCRGIREATHIILSASDPYKRVLQTFCPWEGDSVPDKLIPYHLDHIFVSTHLEHTDPICHDIYPVSDHMPIEMDVYQ
jgi:endonuclease/exonuclease/phosphatase family metal-dependent hydrolase